MIYLAKETLLWAYKTLSTLSNDPNLQGATQKISAIRYVLALDMFYKQYKRECNTRDSNDKAEFVRNINRIVAINDDFYTPNFYIPLASHQGDCAVGSNFYSVGAVKNSLINPSMVINYPQRGNTPLFEIQNGKLFWRSEMISNLKSYISSEEHKLALALWIVRNYHLDSSYILTEIDKIYHSIFTDELCDILIPKYGTDENLRMIDFTNQLTLIDQNDIERLFNIVHKTYKNNPSLPLQQIFYGAPGTGKSHGVKEVTDKVASEFVFRTTFHPDSDYSTFVGAYKPTMTKKAVRNVAGDIVKESGVEVYEPSIVYTFVPQAFLKAYVAAWKNQEQPVFLVIEEINRGNCAQIFGDIFQLLDRNENGESEYPIKADQDIRDYLAKEFAGYYLEANILSGEELVLPANLYIWATMNTSDQSLFPIDSAFKRRWDWKYVPIAKPDDLDVHIQVGSNEYDWWEFLDTINNHIGEITSSEDKKLGYFFCKACKDDKISTDKFVNKVIFYLWNDVFKDYEVSHEAFKDGTKQLSFAKFFKEDGNANEKTIEKFLQDLGLEPIENILEDSGNEEETMSAEQTADIEQKRYDFWQSFLDYSKNNQEFKELFKRDKPSRMHWYTYGVFKNANCSMCIEQVRRENKFVISFNTTKEIFTKISEYKDEINAKLNGLDLVWMQDLPRSKKESKVVNTFHVNNFEDPTERTQLFEHTIDTLLKMQKVFMEYLQKISQ